MIDKSKEDLTDNFIKSDNEKENKINNNTRNVLVISRYNENVSWIKKILNESWITKILIFNKGPKLINHFINSKIEIYNVPNVGREGGTYLDYIINNYHNLPDNVWFLQADPFEHSPDFLNFFKHENVNKYIDNDIQTLTRDLGYGDVVNNIEEINSFNIEDNLRCNYFLINSFDHQVRGHCKKKDIIHIETVINEYNKIYATDAINYDIFCKQPKNLILYIWSACFFVKKERILSNTIDVYKHLNKFLYDGGYTRDGRRPHCLKQQGGIQGYVLERLWHYIFTHTSYDSLDEYYRLHISSEMVGSYNKKFNEFKLVDRNIGELKINENQDCIVFFKEDGKIKTLPCIELVGNVSKKKISLDEAKKELK